MERRNFFRSTLGALASLPFLNRGESARQGISLYGGRLKPFTMPMNLQTLRVSFPPEDLGAFPESQWPTPQPDTKTGLGSLVVYVTYTGVTYAEL